MKRGILGLLFALMLMAALSLVMAAPAGANGAATLYVSKWVEHPTNPIFDPTAKAYYPTVVKVSDTDYRIWYGSDSGVGYATSSDGLAWTEQANPVTGLANANHPHVEYIDGNYIMWYWDTTQLYSINAIRYAESTDGITWTNDQPLTQVGTTVIAAAGWNRGSYGPCDVFYNAAGSDTITPPVDAASVWANKFVMYYDGTSGGTEDVGLAVSADGKQWQGYNGSAAPVLAHSAGGVWDDKYTTLCTVLKINGIYNMWYSGGHSASNEGIGYAISTDGLNWTKDPNNPYLRKTDGVAWRADRTYTPTVIRDGSVYKMWFSGVASGNYAIGYATLNADYATIWAAITAANPGDTINVANGTYTATSLESIVITKDNLSLIGESRDGTIIDAGTWGTSGAGWPTGIHVYANNVTIQNFTVQGFTGDGVNTGGYGILFRDFAHDMPAEGYIYYSGGVVDNVKLQNNYSPMYALVNRNLTVSNSLIQNNLSDGMFIARESDNATITGNTVINSGDQGIWVGICWMGLGPSDNATITNNTVDGAREGGISFVASSGATISGNTITNVAGVPPDDGWSRGALSLKDGCSNVEAFNNTIYNNAGNWNGYSGTGNGIGIDGTPSNIWLHDNNVYGNTGYGCRNYSTVPVLAEDNWWGSANGPTHAGNTFNVGAQGETVSDYVDYAPWLDAASPGGASFAPVNDTDTGGQFSSIQAAINAANPGDTVNVAVGTYDESVTINKNNLTLNGEVGSMPAITGGLKFDNMSGLTLQNFYVTGTVDTGSKDSLVRMYNTITDLTIDKCVFDGENVADRMGFSGGQIEGDLTVTNSEFKNIMGWAVLDTKSGSGGDGSALGTVTFANNNIHECNGSIVFRGLSTDRTDAVNAYDNTWNNIGGNNAEQGEQWAALEVNRAISADVYNNTVNNVALGEYGEGQAFQFWDIDTLKVHGNDITNNYQGIWIYSGGNFAAPGGYISFNNIVGNDQYGISVDPTVTGGTLDATNNWWGANDGPSDGAGVTDPVTAKAAEGTGDKVSANVHFDPWTGASIENSKTETVNNDTVDDTNEADTEVVVNGNATVTVSSYSANPGSTFTGNIGKYVDVHIDSAAGVTELEIRLYYTQSEIGGLVESSLRLYWWDGTAWVECSDGGADTNDIDAPPPAGAPYSGYMWAKIRNDTTPTLADLVGSPFGGIGSGGGGGGGVGGGAILPSVSGLVAVPSLELDPDGVLQATCHLKTTDGRLALDIAKGTKLLDPAGKPLRILSAAHELLPPSAPPDAVIILAYNIGPSGANFSPPLNMTISYDPAALPEDVAEENLYIAYRDGSKWVALETTVDTLNRTASCPLSHFTTFALIGSVTQPAPATFSASNLSINPAEVKPNSTVNIALSVANTGDTEGSHSVVLKINGVKEAEKSLTLAAGKSQNISFSVTKAEAGSYSVTVEGLSGSFTVTAPAAEEALPPAAAAPIAWWIWVIVGVVVVGLIIFFTVRRRAY